MIPFNPCGLICDWGRHRYKTRCRFFKDSDRVDEILWYPAAPGAKCIPFPTIFYQGIWDRDPDGIDEYVEGPGEQWDEQHITTHMGVVPGSGTGHYCGTPEMFLEGAKFDALFHTDIRPDGLPVCCPGGPPKGLLWLGRSVVVPGFTGGIVWRGRSPQGWDIGYYAQSSSDIVGPMTRGFGPTSGSWFYGFGTVHLDGPEVTGIAGRWQLVSDGGSYPSGVWRVDGWTGWGTAVFTLVAGGPPATWTVYRSDGL